MRGLTLPFAPTKTYGPISIDLREKQRKEKKKISLSLFTLPLSRKMPFLFYFHFYPFFLFFLFLLFIFILIIIIWIHDSYCLIRVRFCRETIYLFSVHFILNEFSSSHFLTFEIFVKISSLKSLTAYHLENHKNILAISEFDETFLGH